MNTMKMQAINEQSDKELEKLLSDKRAAVCQFRFDISGSKAKNLNEGADLRKDVARIMTELSLRSNRKTSFSRSSLGSERADTPTSLTRLGNKK